MEKSRISGMRSGSKPLIVITTAIILSIIIMISLFIIYFNKVYSSVLEKDMEQIEWTSHYVTKLIHTEIQHSVDILQASEEIFHASEGTGQKGVQGSLQEIREGLHFEKIGVASLDGSSIDDTGVIRKLADPRLFESILNDQSYISNVLTASDDMVIAVPLHHGGQVVGALWGYLSISSIAESIEMDKEMHRYFQIVDDNGNYISHSGNVHAFAEDLNIWEEMKRYTFADGVTVESIHQDVVNGESGYFYFSFQNQGRYVTYEPLGINNWYVFSVVVESFLKDYVENIENIFVWLLIGLSVCVMAVFAIIAHFIRQVMKMIQMKNQIDPLTGLYNRETFIQKTEEILRLPDSNSPGVSALFLLDLDHLKK